MSKSSSNTISIIIATLNADATLQSCIDSVQRQTWHKKEIIVCDGGSDDQTIDILKCNDSVLAYWHSEPDKGIYNAWNKGLSHATGDWICFLGADDYFWDEKVLEKYMTSANQVYPEIRVIYGQVALVSKDGFVVRRIGAPWEQEKRRFRQVSCLPHPGLLCHRDVFEQYGQFEDSFRIAGDYEFLLRELLTRDAHFVPELVTVGMRTGGISSRSSTIRLGYEECRMAQRMHNIHWPGFRWLLGYAFALGRWTIAKVIGERSVDQIISNMHSENKQK